MKLYVCYEDEGPTGVGGATIMSYSVPYKKLLIIEGTYDEIKEQLEKIEKVLPVNGRRSPKLGHFYWDDDDEFGMGNDIIYYGIGK